MSYVSPDQQERIDALRTDQYEELERLEEAPLRQIVAQVIEQCGGRSRSRVCGLCDPCDNSYCMGCGAPQGSLRDMLEAEWEEQIANS